MNNNDDEFKFTYINYYGYNDFAGGFFVKEVCDNIDLLEKSIYDFNKDVETVEDAYRFLWCISFKKMVLEIDYFKIETELKNRIINLSKAINPSVPSFIQSINNNYREYFDKSKNENERCADFFYQLLEFCYGKYCGGINDDVFRYLEANFPLHILSDFDCCSKYYSEHTEAFKTLFSGIKDTKLFDDKIYLRYLMTTNSKNNDFLKEQAAFICERTLDGIKKMNLMEDDQNIIQVLSMLQDYGKLANLYKLRCVNEYAVLNKDMQKKLDAFIRKHGMHQIMGLIDLKPAIDILKTSDDPYIFIQLTHENDENGKISNSLDYIFKIDNKQNPLSEEFNDISRNRSQKFPYYKQDSMQIFLWIRSRIINLIFNNDKLASDFANYMCNISLQLQKEYFDNSIDIKKEITGVVDCFGTIINLIRQNQFETPFGRALVFGTSLSICTTIEKILRNVGLKEVKDDIYFNTAKATLADFFRPPFKLADISKGLKYHLEFYLIREVDYRGDDMSKPGLNIRNNIMHGQDDAYEQTNYDTCLILFYFLLSLLDDLLISAEGNNHEDL